MLFANWVFAERNTSYLVLFFVFVCVLSSVFHISTGLLIDQWNFVILSFHMNPHAML